MLEYLPVIIAALAGSCLSFFCGFGLGTLLLPAFLLFFPLEIAIAASAVVHMLNNIFKLVLVGKYADWSVIKGFGLLSVVGAVAGALSLTLFTHLSPITTYSMRGADYAITPINLVIGFVIIGFAFLEVLPRFQKLTFSKQMLPLGGLVSGYFGGLSGHQGALRSAFLMKAGLSKEAFIGTRVVAAMLVDFSRITVYSTQIKSGWTLINPYLITAATLAAFTGAWLGNKWMKKTELRIINIIISISLVLFGVALIMGRMN